MNATGSFPLTEQKLAGQVKVFKANVYLVDDRRNKKKHAQLPGKASANISLLIVNIQHLSDWLNVSAVSLMHVEDVNNLDKENSHVVAKEVIFKGSNGTNRNKTQWH